MRLLSILLWCLLCSVSWGQVFIPLNNQFDDEEMFVNLQQVQTMQNWPMKEHSTSTEVMPGTRIFFRGDRHCDYVNVRQTLKQIAPLLRFASRWYPFDGLPVRSPLQPDGTVQP